MEDEAQTQKEMPKYRSHKVVHALQIAIVDRHESPGGATITPREDGYAPFQVREEYVTKHEPIAGGYYVVYGDGYESFSPAGAFEGGYSRME